MSLNYDTETSGLPNKENVPHFTHLHVHSHYSMLDGMSKVPDLVAKCKKNGMYSLALTDHGNMFGIKDFADTVNKENGKVKDAIKEVKAEKTKLESNESGEMSEEEKANLYQQTQEKLAQKQQALIEPIQKKVEAEVKAVAESKGLQVVIDKGAVVYGGTDITQDVIRKMAK